MSTAPVPLRQLDRATARGLRQAAEQVLAETGTAAPSERLFQRVAEAAGSSGDALRFHCRPVDTDDGLFILRGLDVEDGGLPATPRRWATAGDGAAVHDIVLLLLAAMMGDPIAWPGQQDGKFVHNIVPSPGHETEQTGASSTVLLSPHTEDAFHPGRAHLLMLSCMRNRDRIATTAASVRRIRLSDRDVATLSQPAVPILPDDAYAKARGYDRHPPTPVPTLFAAAGGLTLRFDPAYTPLEEADEPYREAYRRLEAELARVSVSVSLDPGDVLVVDNDLTVHGRVPFRPRYDGTDRWLKRASVHVPGRPTRPPGEDAEHGYGQAVLRAGIG